MSEAEKQHIEEEEDVNYRAPKEVPLSEILNKDTDDVALNKYKQQLLGSAANVIIEPSDNRKVLMTKATLVFDDHPEIYFDLKGNIEKLKEHTIVIKEGATYKVKLEFYVQRDIVSGLKYVQTAYRGPIKTDKTTYMLGSRAPKPEVQSYIGEKETAPSGMLARGKYTMKTQITDDDKRIYLTWEWNLEIAKDWK